MDKQLQHLKKSKTMNNLRFNETMRKHVHATIRATDVMHQILPLLTGPKTGSHITELLYVKNIEAIIQNEGLIYIALHEGQQQELIQAAWQNEEKYYRLTKKGKAMLSSKANKTVGILSEGTSI